MASNYIELMLNGVTMLLIISKFSELHFSKLLNVYNESIISAGKERYPFCTDVEQRFRAESDFYHYLNSVFFHQPNSFCAIWAASGEYKTALRLEPYCDGLLLCGLETAPEARNEGFATALLKAVLHNLSEHNIGTVYSHVNKTNVSSLTVHQNCGFQIIKNHAVCLDGSVLHDSYTLAFTCKKSEI